MKLLLTTIAAVLVVGCGDTSIHEAVKTGNIEAVKQHLAAGTDVNAKDGTGRTPLHWAAFGGYKEIVELLIAKGADVNARTKRDGDTPLDWVIKFKHPKTADLLRKHGGKAKTPDISIHEAARQGKIEVVKQHLTDGADVNAKLGGGSTPLFLAALEGHREVAELLIENGADVNAKGFGTTPLDMAYDSAELAALLRKHGGKTRKELQAAGN